MPISIVPRLHPSRAASRPPEDDGSQIDESLVALRAVIALRPSDKNRSACIAARRARARRYCVAWRAKYFAASAIAHGAIRDRARPLWRGTHWQAASAVVSLAWFMAAAPPQREGIAIAPLLARLLGGKPRRIFRRRQFGFCSVAPLRRAFGRSLPIRSATPKAKRANQEYDSLKGDSLSPARGGWLVARNQTRKEV
jgi:hypothetical protein